MLFKVFFIWRAFELFLESLFECKELKLDDLGDTKNFLYETKGDTTFPGLIFLSLIINRGISNYLLVSSNFELVLIIYISSGFNEFQAIFLQSDNFSSNCLIVDKQRFLYFWNSISSANIYLFFSLYTCYISRFGIEFNLFYLTFLIRKRIYFLFAMICSSLAKL